MMQELREVRRELLEMRTRQSEQMTRGGGRVSSGNETRITEEELAQLRSLMPGSGDQLTGATNPSRTAPRQAEMFKERDTRVPPPPDWLEEAWQR